VIKTGKTSAETVFHLSTLNIEARTAVQWAAHIRDHWKIESRNHNRRDCTLLEDKTRSKNPNLVANLAVLRSVLLLINSRTESQNLAELVDNLRDSKCTVFRMVTSKLKPK